MTRSRGDELTYVCQKTVPIKTILRCRVLLVFLRLFINGRVCVNMSEHDRRENKQECHMMGTYSDLCPQ